MHNYTRAFAALQKSRIVSPKHIKYIAKTNLAHRIILRKEALSDILEFSNLGDRWSLTPETALNSSRLIETRYDANLAVVMDVLESIMLPTI